MVRRKSRVSRRGKRSRVSRVSRVSRRGKRSRTSKVSRRGKRSRTSKVSRRNKRSVISVRGGNQSDKKYIETQVKIFVKSHPEFNVDDILTTLSYLKGIDEIGFPEIRQMWDSGDIILSKTNEENERIKMEYVLPDEGRTTGSTLGPGDYYERKSRTNRERWEGRNEVW